MTLHFLSHASKLCRAAEQVEETVPVFSQFGERYRNDEENRVSYLLVGCTTYRVLQDSEFQQTVFVWELNSVANEKPSILGTEFVPKTANWESTI